MGNYINGIEAEPHPSNWSTVDSFRNGITSFALSIAICEGMERLTGRNFGNPRANDVKEGFANPTFLATLHLVARMPILEETGCRILPSLLADRFDPKNKNSDRLLLGMFCSLGFAAIHKINSSEKPETKGFPLSQFAAGLLFWKAQRKGGSKHAVLTHVSHNAISALVGISNRK